jgi:hypothetical protein
MEEAEKEVKTFPGKFEFLKCETWFLNFHFLNGTGSSVRDAGSDGIEIRAENAVQKQQQHAISAPSQDHPRRIRPAGILHSSFSRRVHHVYHVQ